MRTSFKWIFILLLNVIVISIHLYFGRKTSLSGSECVRMMEEEAEKEILFSVFFSPQVVSFISFVVCLDLKGGDRLQALFSPR